MTPNLSPVTGIGGDFAIPVEAVDGPSGRSAWFATGRDALAAVAVGRRGRWLVPAFMCPVVPATLQQVGCRVEPYRWADPWLVDAPDLRTRLRGAAGIVVPYFMGLAPDERIWEVLASTRTCVIEDRCQCIGPPPDRRDLRGDFAIGSFRKWYATPDGAYCVAKHGSAPRPGKGINSAMVHLRLAAALVRRVREDGDTDGPELERAQVALFRAGEEAAAGSPPGARASRFASVLLRRIQHGSIGRLRRTNQAAIARGLQGMAGVRVWEPAPGVLSSTETPALGVALRCTRAGALRRHLSQSRIFCAVHWSDGDWSGTDARASRWARTTLTVPSDQRYTPDDMAFVLERIGRWTC